MSPEVMKAWMAEHVYLTVGTAVAITVVLMFLGHDALKKLHLRLFQVAAASLVAVGAAVIWSGPSDRNMLTLGAAVLLATALAFYSVSRMCKQHDKIIKKHEAVIKQMQEKPTLQVYVDPVTKGEAAKS